MDNSNQPLNKQSPTNQPMRGYDHFVRLRDRRLAQVLRASQLALALVAILCLSIGFYGDALVLLCTGVFLFSVDWALAHQKQLLGSWILLLSLTLALAYLAWIGSGIRDTAVLGFSGVLIFAALLGDKRLLLVLTLTMISTCLLIAAGNQYGWHVNQIEATNMTTGTMVVIVLSVVSYCVWLIVHDYRAALDELAVDNIQLAEAKQHIDFLGLHDPLTLLPNRTMAQRQFRELYGEGEAALGIIFIDLDNLKPINDSLGHQAGDSLLQEVARRLVQFAGDENLTCRYGGDEFIVFLPQLTSEDEASQASVQILQLISDSFHYRDMDIFCTCSIGIALAPQDGQDLDTLIKKADIAMYHSKDSGRNSFRFFNPAISRNMLEHISLVSSMRKALQEQQFELYYQPKIDLKHNNICGFEALLRWQHPEQGFISPSVFIPLAESSGLIVPLGEWVLNQACRQARLWYDHWEQDFSLAVNISSIQFKRGNLDNLVLNALTHNQLPPQYLELELTESLLIEDNERLSSTLAALRRLGVHLSIDDFGTGYSNLGYLKKFEVESLKIDQSFVRKMEDHTGDAAIVKAIIQMASSLGLKTIAEGVEAPDTAALLRALGCTQAQGYYWAKPMSAQDATQFWEDWVSKHPVQV